MATWNCTGGPCTVDCAGGGPVQSTVQGGGCTVDCAGGAVQSIQSKLGFLALFLIGQKKIEIFFFHHHDRLGWTIHNSKKNIHLLEKNVFRPFWVHFMSILGNFGLLGNFF